jgi:hypothetical protein
MIATWSATQPRSTQAKLHQWVISVPARKTAKSKDRVGCRLRVVGARVDSVTRRLEMGRVRERVWATAIAFIKKRNGRPRKGQCRSAPVIVDGDRDLRLIVSDSTPCRGGCGLLELG